MTHARTWSEARQHAVQWNPPSLSTTFVVPHPDDEVLMFGGLLQTLVRRGVAVDVLAVTDGGASHPDVDDLCARRRAEQDRALGALGADAAVVHRLGLPDGDVAAHQDSIVDAIVGLGSSLIVAPWVHDHHCDHEACGEAAVAASAITGAATAFGLFWSWSHTDPERLAHQRLIRLPLDERTRERRRIAAMEHRTQVTDEVGPVLLGEFELSSLDWSDEYYVTNVEP